MKTKLYILAVSIFIFISACGSGSSSGGEQSRELTSCVSESVIEDNIEFNGNVISRNEYTYTNLCGEPVNLSLGLLTATSIVHISLDINENYTEAASFGYLYIACRPPSVGIDGDTDLPALQFECS